MSVNPKRVYARDLFGVLIFCLYRFCLLVHPRLLNILKAFCCLSTSTGLQELSREISDPIKSLDIMARRFNLIFQ